MYFCAMILNLSDIFADTSTQKLPYERNHKMETVARKKNSDKIIDVSDVKSKKTRIYKVLRLRRSVKLINVLRRF